MVCVGHNSDYIRRVKYLTDQLSEAGVEVVGALFDLTSQRLVRLAVAITRNQCDAEDAVQAVMVRIASKPYQLQSAHSTWAYLLQMVRHESLHILRKRKQLRQLGSISDLVVRRRVDEVELQETNRAVWSAIRTLPAEQAEVVVLKIWEQMTFVEIAEILELSPNTVSSRYKYAITKLSAKLAGHAGKVLRD